MSIFRQLTFNILSHRRCCRKRTGTTFLLPTTPRTLVMNKQLIHQLRLRTHNNCKAEHELLDGLHLHWTKTSKPKLHKKWRLCSTFIQTNLHLKIKWHLLLLSVNGIQICSSLFGKAYICEHFPLWVWNKTRSLSNKHEPASHNTCASTKIKANPCWLIWKNQW